MLNNGLVRRVAFAMDTSSVFCGVYTKSPFWCQKINLRQIRSLRRGQPIIGFDAVDNCRLYNTTVKAMKFHYDLPPVPIDKFKDH